MDADIKRRAPGPGDWSYRLGDRAAAGGSVVTVKFHRNDVYENSAILVKLVAGMGPAGNPVPAQVALSLDEYRNRAVAGLEAITQRISRESDDMSARVESLARVLAMWIVDSGCQSILILGAEFMDQASVRLLSRIGLRFVAEGRRIDVQSEVDLLACPAEVDLPARPLHLAWVNAFAAARPQVERAGARRPLTRARSKAPTYASLSDAISSQSYDIAFAILGSGGAGKSQAESNRIRATILVNCGGIEEALNILRQAETLADGDPLTLSRVAYTEGLVLAKRCWRVDQAEGLFRHGIEVTLPCAGPDARLATAWQCNGLALVEAMRAKATGDQAHLKKAAWLLQRARSVIEGDDTEAAFYLRHNLSANGVMLLEMGGAHDAAKRTFEKQFSSLVRTAGESRPSMIYRYRLAGLVFRTGDSPEALSNLSLAREQAVSCRAEQAVARIDLAIATASLKLGRIEDTCTAIHRVIEDSVERGAFGALRAAGDLLKQASTAGDDRWANLLQSVSNGLSRNFSDLPAVPAFPSKLPSYVPFIDLLSDNEGTNEHLNGRATRLGVAS